MAAQSDSDGNDLPAHAESYVRFIWWLKFGTAASAIIAFIAVLLISQ